MQQIQTNATKTTKKNILFRISDVQGGVSLVLSNLVAGKVVPEGTPLTAPVSGQRTVCKQAKILTGSTTTVFRVNSQENNFKVGDILFQVVGGAAYDITTIDSEVGTVDGVVYDTLTIGTALESAAVGTFIYQADAVNTAGSQAWGFSAATTGASASGLANDATTYTATIVIDGVSKSISIAGSASQTMTQVATEITTDLAGAGTCTFNETTDAFDIVSATTGASSSVAITDVDIFATLTNANAAAETAVAGTDVGLANSANAITKEAFTVPSTSQVIWMSDAFVRADVHYQIIGALYLATLPGIIEVQY